MHAVFKETYCPFSPNGQSERLITARSPVQTWQGHEALLAQLDRAIAF